MLRKTVVTAMIAAAALATGGRAAKKCSVDLHPLLRVHEDRQVQVRSIHLPPPPVHVVDDLLVSRGAATSIMRTESTLVYNVHTARQFVSGRAASERLAALVTFFSTVEVGAEPACVFANDYSYLSQPVVVNFGRMEVEWYGNPGPTRIFTIFWGDAANFADLPACGDGEKRLLTELQTFRLGTRGNGLRPLQCPLPAGP